MVTSGPGGDASDPGLADPRLLAESAVIVCVVAQLWQLRPARGSIVGWFDGGGVVQTRKGGTKRVLRCGCVGGRRLGGGAVRRE